MATGPVTRAVRAGVDPAVVRHAARLLPGTAVEIARALLANARQAGASRVVVTREGGRTTVSDDGRGMTGEEGEAILTFGASSASDAVAMDDEPTGVGLFNLAGREALVRSRDWSLRCPRGAFLGLAEAELTTGLPVVGGTSVAFEDDGDVASEAARVAVGMPYATVVEGRPVGRRAASDVLALVAEPGVSRRTLRGTGFEGIVARLEVGDAGGFVASVDDRGDVVDGVAARRLLSLGFEGAPEGPFLRQDGGAWRGAGARYVASIEVRRPGTSPRAIGRAVLEAMGHLCAEAPRQGATEAFRRAAGDAGVSVPPRQATGRALGEGRGVVAVDDARSGWRATGWETVPQVPGATGALCALLDAASPPLAAMASDGVLRGNEVATLVTVVADDEVVARHDGRGWWCDEAGGGRRLVVADRRLSVVLEGPTARLVASLRHAVVGDGPDDVVVHVTPGVDAGAVLALAAAGSGVGRGRGGRRGRAEAPPARGPRRGPAGARGGRGAVAREGPRRRAARHRRARGADLRGRRPRGRHHGRRDRGELRPRRGHRGGG